MNKHTFEEWRAELQAFADREHCSIELAGLWSNRQLMDQILEAWRSDLEIERDNLSQKIGLINKTLRS